MSLLHNKIVSLVVYLYYRVIDNAHHSVQYVYMEDGQLSAVFIMKYK